MTEPKQADPPSWLQSRHFMVGQDRRGNCGSRSEGKLRWPLCGSRCRAPIRACRKRISNAGRRDGFRESRAQHKANPGTLPLLEAAVDLQRQRRLA